MAHDILQGNVLICSMCCFFVCLFVFSCFVLYHACLQKRKKQLQSEELKLLYSIAAVFLVCTVNNLGLFPSHLSFYKKLAHRLYSTSSDWACRLIRKYLDYFMYFHYCSLLCFHRN